MLDWLETYFFFTADVLIIVTAAKASHAIIQHEGCLNELVLLICAAVSRRLVSHGISRNDRNKHERVWNIITYKYWSPYTCNTFNCQ